MLRQIHILYKGELIFSYNLALGLNDDDLANIIPVLKSSIMAPIPGKTFQRPVGDFQIYHRGAGSIFFIMVGDSVDELSHINNILKNAINKFKELFDDPETIKTNIDAKFNFLEFLYLEQRNLNSKIAIIGPGNSGKTTLYNMIKDSDKKKILNFAKNSAFEIEDLSFHIWDFIMKDNFSPLLYKFVAGSDLIILIFDVAKYNLKTIHHFVNIKKSDANFARFLILANKNDLVTSDEDIKLMKNEIGLPNINEISLISPEGRARIISLIIEALRLKVPLPPDYGNVIGKAVEYEEAGNLTEAIMKYRDLITLARKHQDSNSLSSFEKKLEKLESLREERRKLEKEAMRKEAFGSTKQIQFAKKISVKALPTVKALPGGVTTSQIEPVKVVRKHSLSPSDIQIKSKSAIASEKETTKTSIIEELLIKREFDHALLKLIDDKGSSLSLNLCKEYIKELQVVISESLTFIDLQIAADLFIEAEKKIQ